MAVLGFMVMGSVSRLSLANHSKSPSWWCTPCSAKMDAREYSGRRSDMWCLLLTFPELFWFSSVQFSCSVVSDSLRPHELQQARPPCPSTTTASTQTHVHCVGDAIQPSLPLLSPSPSALNLFQHQGLFKWVSSSHQVAKVLEFQLQHQSFQWIFRMDFLYDGVVGSPCSPRDSQESSPTPQFKSINSLRLSFMK